MVRTFPPDTCISDEVRIVQDAVKAIIGKILQSQLPARTTEHRHRPSLPSLPGAFRGDRSRNPDKYIRDLGGQLSRRDTPRRSPTHGTTRRLVYEEYPRYCRK